MKAMILAAGHGKRMGSLSTSTPKPLLKVGDVSLLENKIIGLKQAGVTELVINVAYLPEQIKKFAGDGSRWGVTITYSEEASALETAGGICKALALLGDESFLVINADIWTDYPLQRLTSSSFINNFNKQNKLGHLVLVDNPNEKSIGDFDLDSKGLVKTIGKSDAGSVGLTFSGIAVYQPKLFFNYPKRRDCFPLLEVFQYGIEQGQLGGEYYSGEWDDIGTPDRLQAINIKPSSSFSSQTKTVLAAAGPAANDE